MPPEANSEREWVQPPTVQPSDALREAVGGHPLVTELLLRRGFETVASALAFLDPDAYNPAPPEDFPDLARAVDRLSRAIQENERICVWGDFDVDGQTSTTLLVSALRELGANVMYHIPVRANESHGVNIPRLAEAIDAGAQLILTCDTGVAAHEAIAYANSRGVAVIITDHHELPPSLPDAYAVVNPHRLPAGHPLGTLPGVGVAYKVVEALASQAGKHYVATRGLDLVALGIVADVATQTGDARYLLQRGLDALRHTTRLGLQEMMKLAELNPMQLNESHISFVLGPRLNALGRLDDANVIVDFLSTNDLARARVLAARLEGLNTERQRLCEAVFQGAQAQLERGPALLEYAALVLANPHWHPGVIGIVASRLVEQYHKPTMLISAPEGELARGSARSVEGCNIIEAIAAQEALLAGFGGHEMAAGFAMDAANIPAFRSAVSRAVQAQIGEHIKAPPLEIDAYVGLDALSLALVDELERLAPFGPGNPAPVLATRNLKLAAKRTLGRDAAHLLLTVEDELGTTQRVFWWQWNERPLPGEAPNQPPRFDLAYTVRASTYRGQRELQIEWVDARVVEVPEVVAAPPQRIKVVDYRREPHPRTLLTPLLARDDVQVWVEGGQEGVSGRSRYDLETSETLVVWTSPPDPAIWWHVLEQVAPTTLYLFAVDPGTDTPAAFLKRLAGLVKHALRNKAGVVYVTDLAAATAQREVTVRMGVTWLEASGHIAVLEDSGGILRLAPGTQRRAESAGPHDDAARIVADLQSLLAETAAYRRHFARVADPESLI